MNNLWLVTKAANIVSRQNANHITMLVVVVLTTTDFVQFTDQEQMTGLTLNSSVRITMRNRTKPYNHVIMCWICFLEIQTKWYEDHMEYHRINDTKSPLS